MGDFDQTARQIAKEDGAAFVALLAWLAPSAPLPWRRWDDARRTSWPGGPERTDDLVAILNRPGKESRLILEVQAEPERTTLARLGVYQLLLSLELPEGSEVGAVLLHLTGKLDAKALTLKVAGLGDELVVKPIVIDLATKDGAATLAEIEGGRLGPACLPWVVLMRGAGELALMERWKLAAERDEDEGRRIKYRAWALVFAELRQELVTWQRALEGWQMKKSQVISEWRDEGAREGNLASKRQGIMDLLTDRFGTVPESIRLALEGTNDPDRLRYLLRQVYQVASLQAFEMLMAH